ncbi:MAG: autotransporter-associated beta strand repeat-containing protein, partial [Chthoniobacterales bacterium]
NPSGNGSEVTLQSPVILADTITIYVGARVLGGTTIGLSSYDYGSIHGDSSWINLFHARDSDTNFDSFGGSISFDTTTPWYFDSDPSTLESFSGKYDFYSVAQHEIEHLLGFNDGVNAFRANTAGANFTGPTVEALYGGPAPLDSVSDRSHWSEGLMSGGSEVIMDPSISSNLRKNVTPLDLAVLEDIGYNITTYAAPDTTNTVGANNASTTISQPLADGATPVSLGKVGNGTIVISADNTYTGGTVIQQGTLQIGAGGTTGSIVGNIVDNATLAFNRSDSYLFAGNISGTGQLQQIGHGALSLSGNNTYAGGTVLKSGTLNINSAHAIGTGPLTINGIAVIDNTSGAAITLATDNTQNWNSNFTFGGTYDLNLGKGSVSMNSNRTITVSAGSLDVGGSISGKQTIYGITKAGPGTLILSGNSTYGGMTTISAGALQIGDGDTSGSIVNSKIFNNALLTFNRSDTFTVSNKISGSGVLVNNGSGSLILNGINSYTGGTIINGGTLISGNVFALGSSTASLTINKGTFDLNGNNVVVGLLTGANILPAIITNQGTKAAILTIKNTLPADYAGSIQNGSAVTALLKSGTGAQSLSGNNTFSGGTTLNAGTLNINSATALGTGVLSITGISSIDNTSGTPITLGSITPQSWNSNFTFKGTNDLSLGMGNALMSATRTLTINAGNLTVDGVISGAKISVGLIKAGTGTLILSANNTYTGTTTIKTGTLQVGNGGTSGSIALKSKIANTGMLIFNHSDNFIVANTISGKGKVIDNGSGALTLTGANTYTGGTILNEGTLQVGSAGALGKGNVTLNDGTLGTNAVQHQINVNGNLLWDSAAEIALTLTTNPLTSEKVKITGTLQALDNNPLIFDFTPLNLPMGDTTFLIMTAAKGFGNFTASSFSFTSSDPGLHGTFRIDGKNLFFDDGYDPDPVHSFASNGDFQPVPEPGTITLLLLGGIIFIGTRSVIRRYNLSS